MENSLVEQIINKVKEGKEETKEAAFGFSNSFANELQVGIKSAMYSLQAEYGLKDGIEAAELSKLIAQELEYMVTAKLFVTATEGEIENCPVEPINVMKFINDHDAKTISLLLVVDAFLYGIHFAKTEMK